MTLAHATVEELRVLLERASPGPWEAERTGERGADVADADGRFAAHASGVHAHADAALIAAMRNSLPALLDRLERAEKVEAVFRKFADDLGFIGHGLLGIEAHTRLRAALDDEAPR